MNSSHICGYFFPCQHHHSSLWIKLQKTFFHILTSTKQKFMGTTFYSSDWVRSHGVKLKIIKTLKAEEPMFPFVTVPAEQDGDYVETSESHTRAFKTE